LALFSSVIVGTDGVAANAADAGVDDGDVADGARKRFTGAGAGAPPVDDDVGDVDGTVPAKFGIHSRLNNSLTYLS
jgi:hypothetical protein